MFSGEVNKFTKIIFRIRQEEPICDQKFEGRKEVMAIFIGRWSKGDSGRSETTKGENYPKIPDANIEIPSKGPVYTRLLPALLASGMWGAF